MINYVEIPEEFSTQQTIQFSATQILVVFWKRNLQRYDWFCLQKWVRQNPLNKQHAEEHLIMPESQGGNCFHSETCSLNVLPFCGGTKMKHIRALGLCINLSFSLDVIGTIMISSGRFWGPVLVQSPAVNQWWCMHCMVQKGNIFWRIPRFEIMNDDDGQGTQGNM